MNIHKFGKENKLGSCKKGTTYNAVVEKYTGFKNKSKLTVDWLVK